jgi:hypothetical protein
MEANTDCGGFRTQLNTEAQSLDGGGAV